MGRTLVYMALATVLVAVVVALIVGPVVVSAIANHQAEIAAYL